jgi:hypothetical protein
MASLMLAAFLSAEILSIRAGPSPSPGEWITLENCQFLPDKYHDADSFHVRWQKEEYTFRLYFVDAPETDLHRAWLRSSCGTATFV